MRDRLRKGLEPVRQDLGEPARLNSQAPAATGTGSERQHGADSDRQKWFARFAAERVMPFLRQAEEDLKKRGCSSASRLIETGGRLVAELKVVPPGLPPGASPPRLMITTARAPRMANAPTTRDHPLLVEFTGTFPGVGATGGFGGEVDYDSIYPSQVEEKILEFLDLTTGG